MYIRKSAILAGIIFMAMQVKAESPEKPNRGLLMWSAFSCSTYAELLGDNLERERLFNVGYKTGKALLADIQNQKIQKEEFERLPTGVRLGLGGPTIDFMIGRIFVGAVDYAYDKVVKEDSNGLLLNDPSKWADGKLKELKAKNKYHESNCALIQ